MTRKRRHFVVVLLALVFASPATATAANIVVTNTSSLPDAGIANALPAFQRALDEDFAPAWPPMARGSKLFLGTAPPDAWEIRVVDSPDCTVLCRIPRRRQGASPTVSSRRSTTGS